MEEKGQYHSGSIWERVIWPFLAFRIDDGAQAKENRCCLKDREWCTGKTQRDRVEREAGGGLGMGNTGKSMADPCQCVAKTTTIL